MFASIKEIHAPELAQLLAHKDNDIRVIDVREAREITAGVIHGADHMPLASIPLKLNEIRREEKVVLVCRSGARSAQACAFLDNQGYEHVYNLRGGMMDWHRSGLPATEPQFT
ncbi:MAG: hypothetical protein BMS9Abin26_2115 [Gammaproteobacteria bacterium]|nr:MAG: hypothetical protein BMS9Abin26_2115 [Gammaproteobacteria bacterium]